MQASRDDVKHAEERRALSNSPLSTNVVETMQANNQTIFTIYNDDVIYYYYLHLACLLTTICNVESRKM